MDIGEVPEYTEWEDIETGERLFILSGAVTTEISLAGDVPDQYYINKRIPGDFPWEDTIGKRYLRKVEA